MLYRQIIAVCFDSHIKHIYMYCVGKMKSSCLLTLVVHKVTTQPQWVNYALVRRVMQKFGHGLRQCIE